MRWSFKYISSNFNGASKDEQQHKDEAAAAAAAVSSKNETENRGKAYLKRNKNIYTHKTTRKREFRVVLR